jgi:hypothetical protein
MDMSMSDKPIVRFRHIGAGYNSQLLKANIHPLLISQVSRWEQKPVKSFPLACSSIPPGTNKAVFVPAQ